MDNQHKKISGYRDLTQADIDLMNEIKALGPQIEAVLSKVQAHLDRQVHAAEGLASSDNQARISELARFAATQPQRWTSIARTDFQTGLMALTRAVAQPSTF
jgi:hypothetical protein